MSKASQDSWDAGVTAGQEDLAWIADQLGVEIDPVDLDQPALTIARRSATVGQSFELAYLRARQEAVDGASLGAVEDTGDDEDEEDDDDSEDEDDPDVIALAVTAFRIDRIAATENSVEFSTARRKHVAEALGALYLLWPRSGIKTVRKVVQVWDARLDACARCKDLDGEETEVGQPYREGALPGYVHAWCRCIDRFEIRQIPAD